MLKKLLKKIISARIRQEMRESQRVLRWYFQGCPVPPPSQIKRRLLKKFARRGSAKIFIETGTAGGTTIEKLRKFFQTVFSIEIYKPFADAAKEKFKNDPAITIIKGDSGEVLPRILANIKEPVLFWLDGHYSGGGTGKGITETPIVKEIDSILSHPIKDHVILIDDARCFNGTGDYPELEEFKTMIINKASELSFEVIRDIIVLKKK